jgi:hypothetical protein
VEEPEIVIVIEGGLVSAVATTKDKLTYRIVDLDVTKVQDPEDSGITDQEADATEIDIEEYTETALKGM